jgi:hypothetical protein
MTATLELNDNTDFRLLQKRKKKCATARPELRAAIKTTTAVQTACHRPPNDVGGKQTNRVRVGE